MLVHHKSKQIPGLFVRQRGDCDLSTALSAENVLNAAASVRTCISISNDNELDDARSASERHAGDLASAQDEMSLFQSEKHQLSTHSKRIVKEIEKWLKNAGDSISSSGINFRNNSREDMERFLTEQIPEVFFKKDTSTEDIDIIANKLNTSYDTILNELHNEKFLSACEKDDVFTLPDLKLDDILLDEIISPSASIHSPYNNSSNNADPKDLVKKLQETFTEFNRNNEALNNVQTQNEMIDNSEIIDEINNIDDYINENFCNISLATKIEDLIMENISYKQSVIDDLNYSTNFENTSNSHIAAQQYDSTTTVQKKKKNSYISRHTNSNYTNSTGMKFKFQPSIIKRKKKLDKQNNYWNNKDGVMSVLGVSADKSSNLTQIFINASKNNQGVNKPLICGQTVRRKATHVDSYESDQEEISKARLLSPYSNHQELVISKALEEVGIADDMLKQVIIADNIKVWQCNQNECCRQFAKLCGLKAHLLTHFSIKPFKCDYDGCSWAFYSDFKLKRHKETHLKRKDYVCSVPGCKRRFTTIYNVASHEKLHNRPNRIACQVLNCNAKFQTKRDLEAHMKTHDESFAPYVCDYEDCGKRYYSSNALMSHQRCHSYSEVDVTCGWPGCGKTFDQPCRLKAHMRSHTGHKPYACTFRGCKWAFSTSSKLKRHQKKHTNDRKFVCDFANCSKAFMRSEHLKEHKLTHIEKRLFQCHICAAAFSAKSSLYVHIKKHSNDCAGKAHRQTKKKKTVEKKTANKKKETYCSRVLPVRISINTAKQKSLAMDCLEAKYNSSRSVEEGENVNVSVAASAVDDKSSNPMYFCTADSCTRRYRRKANLKTHLQKKHVTPLAEIQNGIVADAISSPLPPKDLIPQAKERITTMPFQNLYLDGETADETGMLQARTPMDLEFSDVVQEKASGNEGSARTALTCRQILNLKPERSLVDSSVGANDVVLGARDFEDSLLLPDDLSSIYCQAEMDVPGYQILLLDTGPDEGGISMHGLD